MRWLVPVVLVVACAKEPAPSAPTVTLDTPDASAPSSAASASAPASASASAPASASPPPAPQIDGPARPKGDGTCVARATTACSSPPCTPTFVPVPCPVMATAKSTDEELGTSACDWAAACERMGDEGCCVACKNPFRVRLSRACALQIVAKKDCKSVQATWDACAGR
jgi:hypothetical protein